MADNKSYLTYLNKLVDQCNNTYHCSFGKKPFDADYCALAEEIELNPKAPKFKVDDRVRIILSTIIFLLKGTLKRYIYY